MGASSQSVQCKGKREEEEDLVDLCRMAWDAIAEVDAPGECRGFAVGVVCKTAEKAADASNGDTDTEWDSEEVSRTGADTQKLLRKLDEEPATEEAANDSLASSGPKEDLPVEREMRRLFEYAKDTAAEQGSCG